MTQTATAQALAPVVVAGRIAGAANALTLEWARANLPPDAVARVVARCRAAGVDVNELERGTGWASFASHVTLLQALAPEMGARRFFDVGRANAAKVERVVPGAGLLLRLASPKRLIAHADHIWSTYADFGAVRAAATGSRAGTVAFEGLAAPPAFWDCMTGFLTGLLERAGARAPVITREEGARACVLRGTWT